MTDNRTTELLPCPFCGGEASKRLFYGTRYGVYCDECDARVGGLFLTEAEAIAAWNARADYHGYEQAAIEAWESIKAWNTRAERTCHNTHENRWFKCSACGYGFTDLYAEDESDINEQPRYCPNCGCNVVDA